MHDVAIIGGGLCGLALAEALQREGMDVRLFEARARLGGRIHSAVAASSGLGLDLGASWFWRDRQPRIARMLAALGLEDFPQYENGEVLVLEQSDAQPVARDAADLHNGASRLAGGMGALISALSARLAPGSIALEHVLESAADEGEFVRLTFRAQGETHTIDARHVVLAAPPRLIEENVRFDPPLQAHVKEAMQETATWMASEAKAVVAYAAPVWREAGQAGNAFSTHEQSVLGEVFDACDQTAEKAALGGFYALSASARHEFEAGLPLLVESQLAQIFGAGLGQGEVHHHDWAKEAHTCTLKDIQSPRRPEHASIANPYLRRPLWQGRLFLGGSETAMKAAGFLEGALDAAARIGGQIKAAEQARVAALQAAEPARNVASINGVSFAAFNAHVAELAQNAFDAYRQRMIRMLATQDRARMTQRAVRETFDDIFERSLALLRTLDFEMDGAAVEKGRSAFTLIAQAPFRPLMQSLLDDVIAFNQTSCALSNFPDEHSPSADYWQAIVVDVGEAWKDFSLEINAAFLAKAQNGGGGRR